MWMWGQSVHLWMPRMKKCMKCGPPYINCYNERVHAGMINLMWIFFEVDIHWCHTEDAMLSIYNDSLCWEGAAIAPSALIWPMPVKIHISFALNWAGDAHHIPWIITWTFEWRNTKILKNEFILFLSLSFRCGLLTLTSQSESCNLYNLLPGERVLCFHGPLLYEAKVSLESVVVSYRFLEFCLIL